MTPIGTAEPPSGAESQRAPVKPHPFATVDEVTAEGTRWRVLALDAGLGSSDRALKHCTAANRILGSLADPRIRPAASVEHRDGQLVLFSEASKGQSLHEYITARSTPIDAAVKVLIDVCEVLDAAHGLGVIHGALTPFSVLVENYGGHFVVRVTDFGLIDVVSATQVGAGDPRWLPFAPERLLGDDPRPATDVYLIGTLAYALLSGAPVFEGESAELLVRSHSIEEPVPLHELEVEPRIPETLSRILMRCLVKEPEDRYARPGDLAAALRGYGQTAKPDDEDDPHTVLMVYPSAPDQAEGAAKDEGGGTKPMALRAMPGFEGINEAAGSTPSMNSAQTSASKKGPSIALIVVLLIVLAIPIAFGIMFVLGRFVVK